MLKNELQSAKHQLNVADANCEREKLLNSVLSKQIEEKDKTIRHQEGELQQLKRQLSNLQADNDDSFVTADDSFLTVDYFSESVAELDHEKSTVMLPETPDSASASTFIGEHIDFCKFEFLDGPGACTDPNCQLSHDLDFRKVRKGVCFHEFRSAGSCHRKENCFFTHQIPQSLRDNEWMRKDVEKEEKRAKRKRQEREDLAANAMMEENRPTRSLSSQDSCHSSSTLIKPRVQPSSNPSSPISISNNENEFSRMQFRNDFPSDNREEIGSDGASKSPLNQETLPVHDIPVSRGMNQQSYPVKTSTSSCTNNQPEGASAEYVDPSASGSTSQPMHQINSPEYTFSIQHQHFLHLIRSMIQEQLPQMMMMMAQNQAQPYHAGYTYNPQE